MAEKMQLLTVGEYGAFACGIAFLVLTGPPVAAVVGAAVLWEVRWLAADCMTYLPNLNLNAFLSHPHALHYSSGSFL